MREQSDEKYSTVDRSRNTGCGSHFGNGDAIFKNKLDKNITASAALKQELQFQQIFGLWDNMKTHICI